MDAVYNYRYSLLAGVCAAGGSFFGKLPSFLSTQNLLQFSEIQSTSNFYADFLLLRVLPISLMVLCNLLNWRYFLKALQFAEQTLTATVFTAASNYMISFLLGTIFYHEPISLLTVLGSTLILIGLWFLCGTTSTQEKNINVKLKNK